MTQSYTDEITEQANQTTTLGAEYFEARNKVEEFLVHWKTEHAEILADEIIKPIIDTIQDRVSDAFRDYLLSDVEQNLAGTMRDMVEKSVTALIGGENWANIKYISPEGYRTEKVRETLAKLYSDEIKDGRIADLEKQVERLERDLKFYRERY